jgi:hypothetical protein
MKSKTADLFYPIGMIECTNFALSLPAIDVNNKNNCRYLR